MIDYKKPTIQDLVNPPGSMANHVLVTWVTCAIRNLHTSVWRRDDVQQWLDGMDDATREAVRTGINEALGLAKKSEQAMQAV